MLNIGKGELSHAYDELISALEKREQIIEKRIAKQIEHLGIDEKILFDHRNYKLELEDIQITKEFREGKILPEEVIAINE